ncbi:MAG: SDR family oxidoreductase [Alphaproteobacteria bacterium]|jgi:gluconate 5-dehydrogenase|nr:SDR family oxidoreductase [Alphaproteobacteria bacterium]MBT4967124.1 SDR family oxidoreductase [Alphaproteobacteria bacterium]MBT5158239.1 SDR family oxidoreductase [Alphaproteobacteria bacterium]MBT5917133.1 SDR family oxidoreductase [Alphaproteobacteria bacterium]MBT6385520.1 SDR family oxidoreductase [Alphaproteobacteria bacterium]
MSNPDAVFQRFSLVGRKALITGSSRGIGWETAKALAEAGAKVFLNGRDEKVLADQVSELKIEGHAADFICFDAFDAEASAAAASTLLQQEGCIDILVSNAGAAFRNSLADTSLGDWRGVLESHLSTGFALAKTLAPAMQQQEWGRIILTSSVMGEVSRPNNTAYTAAKGGMNSLVRALAAELGTDGITCNAIAPGWVLTKATESLSLDNEWNTMIVNRNPLKRWGRPEEIASAMLLLASDAGSFITGQVVTVDGGLSAVL